MLQLIKNVLSWRITVSKKGAEVSKPKEWERNKRLQDQMAMNKEAKKLPALKATVMPFVKPEGGDYYQELCAAEETINALNADKEQLTKELYEATQTLRSLGHGRQQQGQVGYAPLPGAAGYGIFTDTIDWAAAGGAAGLPTITRR